MSYKVLIVEDEPAIARVLDLKLKQIGIDTKVVNDGGLALDILNNENFDCVLLDLILPGADGFTILEAIREKSKETKVIIMTNLGQPEDRIRVEKLGITAYYVKSEVSISQLAESVKQVLMT
jgi:two-component system alkaline phosphatase synthesis response regulator PhoP